VLPNGIAIDGPVELRAELANHPETFVTAMTEKLLMYSVNRPLEYFDRPQVRKVVRDAKKDNYTFASLVLESSIQTRSGSKASAGFKGGSREGG